MINVKTNYLNCIQLVISLICYPVCSIRSSHDGMALIIVSPIIVFAPNRFYRMQQFIIESKLYNCGDNRIMGKTRFKANDSVRFVPKILITMLPDFLRFH